MTVYDNHLYRVLEFVPGVKQKTALGGLQYTTDGSRAGADRPVADELIADLTCNTPDLTRQTLPIFNVSYLTDSGHRAERTPGSAATSKETLAMP